VEDIDMQTRTLTDKLSVSSQVALTDLTAAADQGKSEDDGIWESHHGRA